MMSFRLSSTVAMALSSVLALACAQGFASRDSEPMTLHRMAAEFDAEDLGLESFARLNHAKVHTFPMVFDLENRFSAEIQTQIEGLGEEVAFSGYLRDIRRHGTDFEVVLSGPFGTHILRLTSNGAALGEILGEDTRDAEQRYYVVAAIDNVSRPIVDVIMEEEALSLEVGSVIPPTFYNGRLVVISAAD